MIGERLRDGLKFLCRPTVGIGNRSPMMLKDWDLILSTSSWLNLDLDLFTIKFFRWESSSRLSSFWFINKFQKIWLLLEVKPVKVYILLIRSHVSHKLFVHGHLP